MDKVQVEQDSYEMPPREGFTIAYFLTVADLKRSAEFYKTVFGGEIVSTGDGDAPPYIKIANRGSSSTSGAARHPTNQR
jgi:predicted enzyme related to lactoylglutathione lyase